MADLQVDSIANEAGTSGTSVYLGGVGSDNLLDFYKKNTFSLALEFGGASTGITYASGGNAGKYMRIGNFVHCYCRLELTSKGSATGAAIISGLPFNVGSTNTSRGALSPGFTNNFITGFLGNGNQSTNAISLFLENSTTAVDDADFANNTRIDFEFCYFID